MKVSDGDEIGGLPINELLQIKTLTSNPIQYGGSFWANPMQPTTFVSRYSLRICCRSLVDTFMLLAISFIAILLRF
ncbi:MAG TPA: hypothetical protein PLN41_10590 [Methanothrix sp.]|jgi:hypothetical protein|nr:hypothetical protein [Methanothrix sp.]